MDWPLVLVEPFFSHHLACWQEALRPLGEASLWHTGQGLKAFLLLMQDLLYQPVSLSCGHIYCARCALSAAVGHPNLVGNAEQLLLSMACYSTKKPCPCCRSTQYGSLREKRSPFYDITRMYKLEQALQARQVPPLLTKLVSGRTHA